MPPAIEQLFARLGGARRVGIMGIGVVALVAILGVSRWATKPEMVVAIGGVSLENVGKMTDALDGASVAYELERGGSDIMVAADDQARARVLLASAGLMEHGRPGMELFDQPSWGMTDFAQKINYRRALEGELERTISTMKGIERAQVHLAIKETQAFRRATDTPAEASVVVKLRNGQRPEADVVRGISQLVASSIDNLDAQRVAVLDDGGRLLSRMLDANDPASLSSAQLEQQRAVEDHLAEKAGLMVSQIVGSGNATVTVSADLSFDQVERMSQVVDPDKQALSTEQKAEITPGAEGGAGSTNVASSYDNSRTVETVKSATGVVKRLTVSVLVKDRVDAKGASTARAQAELDQIESLVRNAVGYDSTRGDLVKVVSTAFEGVTAIAAETTGEKVMRTMQQVQRPALGLIGLAIAMVIAMMMMKSLKSQSADARAIALAAARQPQFTTPGQPMNQLANGAQDDEPPVSYEAMRMPVNPLKERVVATAEAYPDVSAKILRNWMRSA
ncbi:MAG TPA: flagellar basal-body MS-ring/collar protein FliF [Gemmatimonadaceae bacterium]|nr:flagellar basal-body MS-ring/collar protein FliF [Gemmatimonadaceae bacterium]